MTRVWFNHWFSTAYHLIALMKQGHGGDVTFIGSSSSSSAVYRGICDEWYVEKELPEQEYVSFCLDFCRRHAIDVFVPRRGMAGIAKALDEFERINVKLMLEPDTGLVSLLDDKIETYRFFETKLNEIVPEYRLCRSSGEFKSAVSEMESPSGRLCYKLTVDEGAKSFRVLDDSIEGLKALYEKPGSKVTRAAAEKIMDMYDFSVPVMVMPYLSGADVSVDCMETDSGRLLIPRFKVGRYSEVKNDPKVTGICNKIMDMMRFEMPANIQFKLEGGVPYLLEINTRMSGGLQLSCAATGINLPLIALNKLLGVPSRWAYLDPWKTRGIMNLETPVIIL